MSVMSVRAAVRALAPYRFSHHPQSVKLDQNESPDDLPDDVKAEVLARVAKVAFNRYPQLHPQTLERQLADRHDWDPDGVVAANGSNSLVMALGLVAALGRSLITVKPSFQLYRVQASLVGAALIEVPLGPGFALPAAELRAAVASTPGLLLLANPAAPTGNLFQVSEVTPLLDAATPATLCVLDEAYCDFSGGGMAESIRGRTNAVSLRTFSKALGLAGARIGYALTTPELAAEIRKALPPFSVSEVQVAIASVILERPELHAERVADTISERARVIAGLRSHGVTAFDSAANFVLFKVADPAAVHQRLLEADVVIRRQDHLPGAEGCLRVTVGSKSENDRFLAALDAALGEPGEAGGPADG